MLRVPIVLMLLGAGLSGCASLAKPSVRSALVGAGVRPPVADCMARRMTDRLSLDQLRKLQRLKGAPGEKASGLTAAEVIARVNRIDDPEVVAVTVSAGAVCTLNG